MGSIIRLIFTTAFFISGVLLLISEGPIVFDVTLFIFIKFIGAVCIYIAYELVRTQQKKEI